MSFTLLGILNAQASGAGGEFFFASFSTADIQIDLTTNKSNDDIYVVFQDTSSNILTARLDSFGSIQWQNTFGPAGTDRFIPRGISVDDTTGDAYSVFWYLTSGSTPYQFILTRYSDGGSFGINKIIDSTATNFELPEGILVDGSDIYLNVKEVDGGFINLSTSGSILNQRVIANNGLSGFQPSIDSLGRLVIPSHNLQVWNVDKTTIDLELQLEISAVRKYFSGTAPDASGNIYYSADGVAANTVVVGKLNSSGTAQWTKEGTAVGFAQVSNIALDSADNAYVGFRNREDASNDNIEIVKFDSSGTILWQRKISNQSGNSTYINNSVAVDGSDNLLVTFATNGKGLFAKLPADGSGLGTYTINGETLDYEAGNLSLSSVTPTLTSPSNTVSTSSFVASNAGLSDSSSSDTIEIVEL